MLHLFSPNLTMNLTYLCYGKLKNMLTVNLKVRFIDEIPILSTKHTIYTLKGILCISRHVRSYLHKN